MMETNAGLSQTLERLKLKLPPPPKAVGVYRPLIVAGEWAYLSGQLSKDADGKVVAGRIGEDLSLEDGKRAAQWAALQAGSLILHELGLKRVGQILRMTGYVQSTPDFHGQSEVMNSASELLVEIFGERGRHARTSVGVASLPLNAAVEIELTLQLK